MEERDVAIIDIPGAFLNAFLDDTVHVKMEGILADALIKIDPVLYGPMATKTSTGKTLIYVRLTRALYGCLKSSLHFFQQLSKVLYDEGFEENPYDPCVVNKIINGKQCTITCHVDDQKNQSCR